MRRWAVGFAWCLLVGCSDKLEPRACGTSAECVQSGVNGDCLPSPASAAKWCAFPDPDGCPAPDLRWGILAGDGLAETCVDATVADAGTD